MWRVSALAVAAAAAFLIAAPPATGQSQSEVDAARQEASRADGDLRKAATDLLAAELKERNLEGSLLATIERFEQASTDLLDAGHENLALRAEIDDLAAQVATLRGSAADAAAAAYRGAASGQAAMWFTDSFHAGVLAGAVLDGHVDRAVSAMEEVDDRRVVLVDMQSELVASESTLRSTQDQLSDAEASLVAQLGIAAEIVELALAEVAAADERYQTALDRVATEERRLAAVVGVEHWRPLVERYFPADRVGEALQVMHCESRGNPDATNPESDAAGLFQFLETTWAFASVNAGFSGASRYEPEANVASAAWLVHHSIATGHPRGPWGHWTCQPDSVSQPL